MNLSRNEIEESGWVGIDTIMELMEDNILKFASLTDVMPDEMRKFILAELDTIIDKAWLIKIRRAQDVYMHELSADVRLP